MHKTEADMQKQQIFILSYFIACINLLLALLFFPETLAMSAADQKSSVTTFLQHLMEHSEEPQQLPADIMNYQDQEFTLHKNVLIYHFTPLMTFAYTNNLALAQEFLAQSLDPKLTVNQSNSQFNTPLMIAAQREHKKFVKFLLENGALPNIVNLHGNSALHNAAQAHNRKIVNLLLRYGADPLLKNKKGQTAASLTRNQAIRNLLATWHAFNSSRTFIKDISEDKAVNVPTALTWQALNLPIQFILTVRGKAFEVKFTPLMVAAYKGNYEIAHQLLDKGALPDATNDEGTTALIVACNFGDENMVLLLLQYGADINKQDNDGMTCLMYATQSNHQNLVKLLLRKGANTNIVNNEGLTAKQLAPTKKEQQKSPDIKKKLELLFQKSRAQSQKTTVESTKEKVPDIQKKIIEKLELLKNALIKLQTQLRAAKTTVD